MNTISIAFTIVNACFTLASVTCAIISVRQTRKQNEYMYQQVEAAQKQVEAAQRQVEAAYKQLEETSKQTEIAQQQLEETRKPDFPTTMRLESIAHSIQRLNITVKEGMQDSK